MRNIKKIFSAAMVSLCVFATVLSVNVQTAWADDSEKPDHIVASDDGSYGYRAWESTPLAIKALDNYQKVFTSVFFPTALEAKIVQMVEILPEPGADNNWKNETRDFRIYIPSVELKATDVLYTIWDDNNGNVYALPAMVINEDFAMAMAPYIGNGCDIAIVRVTLQ